MTAAGGDDRPGADENHAWERLREQRAKDLGEDSPSDPSGRRAPAVGGDEDDDVADNEKRESEPDSDE